ncbi:translesion DNA synthesis-associated protein ImuA [Paraglaciecola sp.]|uniref:translesion DNA synthesis-associated protein ImuA n=1 Tax=Paraglaciecola sp. TaxID=1920173 RepID=UPI00273E39B2|nr:translesion DNA synthesis-associated protein ImuA [Paraglaciecola sp.]MDP5030302.1 translesion DNA synthesis-associated protein ImuA [Paraglaciecola sp.]
MNPILEHLKNKNLLWQANHTSQIAYANSTGFSELDQQLQGGFPQNGVIDIESPIGIGELRLLLPDLLTRQQSGDRLLVFIAPPMLLNSEMLAEFGFELHRVLILKTISSAQSLWCAEQCLASGCCYSVVLWQHDIAINQVKRLHLAADKGDALITMLRQQKTVQTALPVSLALRLRAQPQGLHVEVTKRKGAWPSSAFTVDMSNKWPELNCQSIAENVVQFPNRHSQIA